MLYYFNRTLPLTNGLLIVSDGETPEGTEKINLKLLYEMFKDTKSHGLVSIQFLCALGIFFGLHIQIHKHAITELYRNLLYETLSGARDLEFQANSDLIGEMSFKIKNTTLSNIKRKEEEDKKVVLTLKNHMTSLKNPKNLKKSQRRACTKTLNMKKQNILTLNDRFRTRKQQKRKQKKRTNNFLILIKNITKQIMLQLNKKNKITSSIYLMTCQMKIIPLTIQ